MLAQLLQVYVIQKTVMLWIKVCILGLKCQNQSGNFTSLLMLNIHLNMLYKRAFQLKLEILSVKT